jgi:GNAT superfamily N-acetyltransferase
MPLSAATTVTVRAEPNPEKRRALQESLTALLPKWFGRAESNCHYAEQAELLPGWVAQLHGRDRGLLLVKRHGTWSAEIYWMAVDPTCHRHGVGTALVDTVAAEMRGERRKLLFAFTLAPDSRNEHYARTRKFYESRGFFLAVTDHGAEALGDGGHPMAYYVKLLDR